MSCPQCEEVSRENALLKERIARLEEIVGQHSGNSSRPPSTDGMGKQPKPKSQREKSDKKTGGQKGHEGKTLNWCEKPDKVVALPCAQTCSQCQQDLSGVAGQLESSRQVFDLPEPQPLEVTQYDRYRKACPCCGTVTRSAFPEWVEARMQYGPRVASTISYLWARHMMPMNRLTEMMNDLFGVTISQGTVVNHQERLFNRLASFEELVKILLTHEKMTHADETSWKVSGLLHWIHVLCSKGFTLYRIHRNRGKAALDEIGVVAKLSHYLMHDCWPTYFQFPQAQHLMCLAHLIRACQGITDHDPEQTWAAKLKTLFQGLYHQRKLPDHNGFLTQQEVDHFETAFEATLTLAQQQQPAVAQTTTPPARGRRKKSKSANLLARLQKHRSCILHAVQGHIHTPFFPLDNNQAERDLRLNCVKRKISGGSRSLVSASHFCRAASYISTSRKQGQPVLQALFLAFQGRPFTPSLSHP